MPVSAFTDDESLDQLLQSGGYDDEFRITEIFSRFVPSLKRAFRGTLKSTIHESKPEGFKVGGQETVKENTVQSAVAADDTFSDVFDMSASNGNTTAIPFDGSFDDIMGLVHAQNTNSAANFDPFGEGAVEDDGVIMEFVEYSPMDQIYPDDIKAADLMNIFSTYKVDIFLDDTLRDRKSKLIPFVRDFLDFSNRITDSIKETSSLFDIRGLDTSEIVSYERPILHKFLTGKGLGVSWLSSVVVNDIAEDPNMTMIDLERIMQDRISTQRTDETDRDWYIEPLPFHFNFVDSDTVPFEEDKELYRVLQDTMDQIYMDQRRIERGVYRMEYDIQYISRNPFNRADMSNRLEIIRGSRPKWVVPSERIEPVGFFAKAPRALNTRLRDTRITVPKQSISPDYLQYRGFIESSQPFRTTNVQYVRFLSSPVTKDSYGLNQERSKRLLVDPESHSVSSLQRNDKILLRFDMYPGIGTNHTIVYSPDLEKTEGFQIDSSTGQASGFEPTSIDILCHVVGRPIIEHIDTNTYDCVYNSTPDDTGSYFGYKYYEYLEENDSENFEQFARSGIIQKNMAQVRIRYQKSLLSDYPVIVYPISVGEGIATPAWTGPIVVNQPRIVQRFANRMDLFRTDRLRPGMRVSLVVPKMYWDLLEENNGELTEAIALELGANPYFMGRAKNTLSVLLTRKYSPEMAETYIHNAMITSVEEDSVEIVYATEDGGSTSIRISPTFFRYMFLCSTHQDDSGFFQSVNSRLEEMRSGYEQLEQNMKTETQFAILSPALGRGQKSTWGRKVAEKEVDGRTLYLVQMMEVNSFGNCGDFVVLGRDMVIEELTKRVFERTLVTGTYRENLLKWAFGYFLNSEDPQSVLSALIPSLDEFLRRITGFFRKCESLNFNILDMMAKYVLHYEPFQITNVARDFFHQWIQWNLLRNMEVRFQMRQAIQRDYQEMRDRFQETRPYPFHVIRQIFDKYYSQDGSLMLDYTAWGEEDGYIPDFAPVRSTLRQELEAAFQNNHAQYESFLREWDQYLDKIQRISQVVLDARKEIDIYAIAQQTQSSEPLSTLESIRQIKRRIRKVDLETEYFEKCCRLNMDNQFIENGDETEQIVGCVHDLWILKDMDMTPLEINEKGIILCRYCGRTIREDPVLDTFQGYGEESEIRSFVVEEKEIIMLEPPVLYAADAPEKQWETIYDAAVSSITSTTLLRELYTPENKQEIIQWCIQNFDTMVDRKYNQRIHDPTNEILYPILQEQFKRFMEEDKQAFYNPVTGRYRKGYDQASIQTFIQHRSIVFILYRLNIFAQYQSAEPTDLFNAIMESTRTLNSLQIATYKDRIRKYYSEVDTYYKQKDATVRALLAGRSEAQTRVASKNKDQKKDANIERLDSIIESRIVPTSIRDAVAVLERFVAMHHQGTEPMPNHELTDCKLAKKVGMYWGRQIFASAEPAECGADVIHKEAYGTTTADLEYIRRLEEVIDRAGLRDEKRTVRTVQYIEPEKRILITEAKRRELYEKQLAEILTKQLFGYQKDPKNPEGTRLAEEYQSQIIADLDRAKQISGIQALDRLLGLITDTMTAEAKRQWIEGYFQLSLDELGEIYKEKKEKYDSKYGHKKVQGLQADLVGYVPMEGDATPASVLQGIKEHLNQIMPSSADRYYRILSHLGESIRGLDSKGTTPLWYDYSEMKDKECVRLCKREFYDTRDVMLRLTNRFNLIAKKCVGELMRLYSRSGQAIARETCVLYTRDVRLTEMYITDSPLVEYVEPASPTETLCEQLLRRRERNRTILFQFIWQMLMRIQMQKLGQSDLSGWFALEMDAIQEAAIQRYKREEDLQGFRTLMEAEEGLARKEKRAARAQLYGAEFTKDWDDTFEGKVKLDVVVMSSDSAISKYKSRSIDYDQPFVNLDGYDHYNGPEGEWEGDDEMMYE